MHSERGGEVATAQSSSSFICCSVCGTKRLGAANIGNKSYPVVKSMRKTNGAPFVKLLYLTDLAEIYGAPLVKILHLTDLAQKLLSQRICSYLCADIATVSLCAFRYLCAEIAISIAWRCMAEIVHCSTTASTVPKGSSQINA